ncbi:hypothetical protein M878_32410 [Streptomyces roseochromogenus subsp. oscitans DS 12.976]|uniref:Uncharacterized protein n=1 Tax=Streptomyces roseochromogenus subsp. oscitans DS 12.976 TaxID=1352936 RepID=V6JVD6_STRRC|nr:hypothetical protein M878_32410 [Streptomyces roseochromogenus subsp. oscitans DS 12.976]
MTTVPWAKARTAEDTDAKELPEAPERWLGVPHAAA